ncbi:two-component system sensor histidine kinase NtrB [Shouchella shacheensis]|uniref:two-component system sensor histidine kinase NtrB n=1 Tax=Shouchella shacheensis TaxID=1649580 RepID=UPI000A6C1388|nr:HAMP domain-containing sensor histidine kinase [Shouchella shacheensis]
MNSHSMCNQTTPEGNKDMWQQTKLSLGKVEELSNYKETIDTERSMQALIEELNLPYIKVDEYQQVIGWNTPFLAIFGLMDDDLRHQFVGKLAISIPVFSFMEMYLTKSIRTKKVEKGIFEMDDIIVHLHFFPDVKNQSRSTYVILEDLTLEKKFEHLLTFHHQMEAVSHIAASVAHELRNPLSVIKGFLQLSHLTNDFEKYYGTILSELNRMNVIIEDFLSVSRKKMDRKWQSPVLLIRSLFEIIRAECSLHNVELQFDIQHSSAICHVNESMFKQVILNLLRNSIEAYASSNSSRTLKVKTQFTGDEVVIEISDNGEGMPEEVLGNLGKPFFTTKERGTGVGIPLCKKIIEDHGGSFHVESECEVGTKVAIRLPVLL